MSFLKAPIEQYALRYSDPELKALKSLSRETYGKMKIPQMLAGHLQGHVLQMVSQMVRPQRVLEIGTFTGYSAICLAAGLRNKGVLHTIDIDPAAQEIAMRFFKRAGLGNRIIMHCGNALSIIPAMKGYFDIVYIDADKKNYCRYFDLVFPKIRKGGWLLADNMFWDGQALMPPGRQDRETKAIIAFARKISGDRRLNKFILPIRDGIMIAGKR
ncbi:MAG: class I SAM-dependent methyltransferase [Bacteroidetes bacterium]|nr:class I SAM-dependent methyltransferase [Bacteroidota bacterium]